MLPSMARTHRAQGVALATVLVAVLLVAAIPASPARAENLAVLQAVSRSDARIVAASKQYTRCAVVASTSCLTTAGRAIAVRSSRSAREIRAALDASDHPCVQTIAARTLSALALSNRAGVALTRGQYGLAAGLVSNAIRRISSIGAFAEGCTAALGGG